MSFDRVVAREFLLTLDSILNSLSLPYFLTQGTALGAYRDKDFVPTERDIDLGFLAEDWKDVVGELVKRLLEENIEVETRYRHAPFSYCHTVVAYVPGAKADLVSWHVSLNGRDRFALAPNDPINVPRPYAIVHPRGLLEQRQEVKLFDRVFQIPSPIDTYLEREYGPGWTTPRDDHVSRSRVYGYPG